MTTLQKVILGVAVVLAAIALVLGISNTGSTPAPATQQVGGTASSHVENQAWLFSNGIAMGPQSLYPNVNSEDAIQVGIGSNQASWINTRATTAYVDLGWLILNGTASSTVKVSVGTSTTATITDSFNPAVAPMWSQFIDACQIATSTVSGVWCDNVSNHKSSYPAVIAVPPGQRLNIVVASFCKADGACNTATSTNRGWTTLTLPITYSY